MSSTPALVAYLRMEADMAEARAGQLRAQSEALVAQLGGSQLEKEAGESRLALARGPCQRFGTSTSCA